MSCFVILDSERSEAIDFTKMCLFFIFVPMSRIALQATAPNLTVETFSNSLKYILGALFFLFFKIFNPKKLYPKNKKINLKKIILGPLNVIIFYYTK